MLQAFSIQAPVSFFLVWSSVCVCSPLDPTLMASSLLTRPSHTTSSSSVISVSERKFQYQFLGENGRITKNVWVPQRVTPGSCCKLRLRCSFDESNVAASSSSSAVEVAEAESEEAAAPPTIELEIVGPEAGEAVTTTLVGSGEKLLRNIILDNKLELYGLYGKVMNCGGGGSCGTCVVDILDGKELLNERTDAEYKYLRKKPESWRLSCQTIVGDKSNSGKVIVQRLPQKKK